MNSEALAYAEEVNRRYSLMPKQSRRSAVERLASYGFTASDLSSITGMTWDHASKVKNITREKIISAFNTKTLDSLRSLALSYEQDRRVSGVLVSNIVKWGTSVANISRLAGIPLDEVRGALRDYNSSL